jgi:hypothetical protein
MSISRTDPALGGLSAAQAVQAALAPQRLAIQHSRGSDRNSNVEVEYTAARDCLGCSASAARSGEFSFLASKTTAKKPSAGVLGLHHTLRRVARFSIPFAFTAIFAVTARSAHEMGQSRREASCGFPPCLWGTVAGCERD